MPQDSQSQNQNSRSLDQFYTNSECAKNFFNIIQSQFDLASFDYIVEPSVGNGVFYNLFDPTKRIAIDIDPKIDGAIQMDFLKWDCLVRGNIITIGNPPFGKNSNLAVDFFNHSATFSNVIGFILPKTFRKNSFVKQLDKSFHLVYDDDVPKNSFVFNGKPYDVSCCFQIWQRQENPRQAIKVLDATKTRDYFEFVEPSACDFIVQRVGVKAGQIIIDQKDKYTTKNFFYIKSKHETTLSIFQSIDFNKVKHNTVGYPSVSKKEIFELFLQALNSRVIFF